jgi:hypothetical protein
VTNPLRCAAALASELSTGILSVDQISQPAMCGAPQATDPRETLIGLDDGFAVRVVPGDDTPYFQSHASSLPLCCRLADRVHSWRTRNRSTIEFLS